LISFGLGKHDLGGQQPLVYETTPHNSAAVNA
jgi:hypothetical protein